MWLLCSVVEIYCPNCFRAAYFPRCRNESSTGPLRKSSPICLGKSWPYPWLQVSWALVSGHMVLSPVSNSDLPYVSTTGWAFPLFLLLPPHALPLQLCPCGAFACSLPSVSHFFLPGEVPWCMAAERNAPFITSFIPEPPLQPSTGVSAASSEACSNPSSPTQASVGVWLSRVEGKLLWVVKAGHRKADQPWARPGFGWTLVHSLWHWEPGIWGSQGSVYAFRGEKKLWRQPSLQSLKRAEGTGEG